MEYSRAVKETIASCEKQVPVKIAAIARSLGLEVRLSTFEPGISGSIKNENGKYVIRLNRFESKNRQRFTIAHELAHYFLHRHIIDESSEGIIDTILYRSGESKLVEYQANKLAAELLMPDKIVLHELDEYFGSKISHAAIEKIAEKLQVSKRALEIKLENLTEGWAK